MAFELAPCQAVFAGDPIRYLDMTEPVRRGTGTVLDADELGALVEVRTRSGGTIYTLFAQTPERAWQLCEQIPPEPEYVTVHENLSFPALRERFGYQTMTCCWQVGYLNEEPLPLPPLPFAMRVLKQEELPLISPHYQLVGEDYLVGLLERGDLIGAFDGERLAGFVGLHEEGTVGLLEVLPHYRRRGLATLLQSHLTNLELSRGHVPYGQVMDGNSASLALQQSLGYQRAVGPMYWPEFK